MSDALNGTSNGTASNGDSNYDHGNGNSSNGTPNESSSVAAASTAPPRLSAAQLLQQAHEAKAQQQSSSIITEDPFPPFGSSSASNGLTTDPFPPSTSSDSPAPAPVKAKPLNVSDESAFPSLGMGAGPKKAGTTWGAGGTAAQRIKQQQPAAAAPSSSNGLSSRAATPSSAADDYPKVPTNSSVFTATVQLPSAEIHIHSPAHGAGIGRGRGGPSREAEPTTLGEVMKLLNKRHPTVSVEASTSRQVTTFILKGKGKTAEEDVNAVKRELLGRLAKKVTIEVNVPAGMRAFIIGAKGRTLKQITDSTGASVQVPSRETDDAPESSNAGDTPDGRLIALTISGDSAAVSLARSKILEIVGERASKVQSKLDVPKEYWPLLNGVKGAKIAQLVEAAGATGAVTVQVPRASERRGLSASAEKEEETREEVEKVITVSGEREAVAKVVAAIEAEVVELKRTTKTMKISINKRQHRFLVGQAAEEILAASGCSVETPPMEDSDDQVTIRGPQAGLMIAFPLVNEKADATLVDTLDLFTAHTSALDKKLYSSHLTRYILRKSKFRKLSVDNGVQVYLPRAASIEAGSALIEIVGKDAAGIAGARAEIIAIVRALPPANFAVVEIDSLIHRHLIGKQGSKIKAFEEKKNVEVVFPPDGEDRSDILLVFSGEGNAEQVLAEVRAEMESFAKEAADIKSVTLTIPQALHRAIIGQGGTTLNAIIGEEKLVNVSFGSKPRSGESKGKEAGAEDDLVVIRGPSEEVARVQKEIGRIAEEAKNSEIVNSFTLEFEIDAVHVRHIVGKAGAGVNKLREELGVRVDFEEQAAAGTKRASKSKVVVKGRKENAEEAKKRIIGLVEKLADEVTLTIALPTSLERGSLIGKQGTYLKRLETTYDVRINFPRDGRKGGDDHVEEKGNPNEITVRGSKQGATSAKKELVDLIAYEQENGNVLNFTVSVKSLPRILGKGGVQVNQIKDETAVTVDIDQAGADAVTANITLRGTKAGTATAKKMILAIAKEVDDEARLTIEIPRAFHTTLIGSGGSSIRDLIARAGGPSDARASGNAVRFPRQGDGADTVIITAPKAIAEKIHALLTKEVESLQSRVVYGVAVAHTLHASVIGKGASALQELQRKHGVKVVMPGWNDYPTAGEIVNPEDVKDAAPGDIVKIVGPREAAVAAAAEISKGRASAPTASQTIMVPKKLHAKIAQGGRFFRSLPSGTRVTHDGIKPPSSSLKAKKPLASTASTSSAPRIDDEAGESVESEIEFQVVSLYDGAGEDDSEIPWVIESASQEDADKTVAEIEKALGLAKSATHVGWLTVPRALMPRIVGRGGAGLDKLRSAGVEVDVVGRKDANQLTLTGTPETIDVAYRQILALAAPRPPRQQREEY